MQQRKKEKVPGNFSTSSRLSHATFAGILPADCQIKASKEKSPGTVEFRVEDGSSPKGKTRPYVKDDRTEVWRRHGWLDEANAKTICQAQQHGSGA